MAGHSIDGRMVVRRMDGEKRIKSGGGSSGGVEEEDWRKKAASVGKRAKLRLLCVAGEGAVLRQLQGGFGKQACACSYSARLGVCVTMTTTAVAATLTNDIRILGGGGAAQVEDVVEKEEEGRRRR